MNDTIIPIHPQGLELCIWKATLLDNAKGIGTSFNIKDIDHNHNAFVCYSHCNGYGQLTFDLECDFYKGMYGVKK